MTEQYDKHILCIEYEGYVGSFMRLERLIEAACSHRNGMLSFKSAKGNVFTPPSPYAKTKFRRKHTTVAKDYFYLNSLKPKGLLKVTMASPVGTAFCFGIYELCPALFRR